MNRKDSDYAESKFSLEKDPSSPAECESNTLCLSDKELILLGLISEETVHAYGIEAKIRQRRMDQWTDIGFSSIYRILSKLEKKGFIQTTLEHKGQGATRKVHSLTDRGRQAIEEGVLDRLQRLHNLKNPMHMALAYLNLCPRHEVVKRLENRIQEIDNLVKQLECQCHIPDTNQSMPSHLELLFGHILTHVKAERTFVEEAIKMILSAKGQDFFDPAKG